MFPLIGMGHNPIDTPLTLTTDDITRLLAKMDGPDPGDNTADHFIDGINIKDGQVIVTLAVDPDLGPTLEGFRQSVERRLNNHPTIDQATVVLTAQKPADAPSASPLAPTNKTDEILPGVDRMIAVASGKGGVGKSTVAVNLAIALSGGGQSVGILDADIYGPSVPTMLGLSNRRLDQSGLADEGKPLVPQSAHNIAAMSIGFLIDPESPLVWRGPMIQKALFQLMRDVEWGNLDCMIVDLPPGTGDAQLTLAQKAPLTSAIIVTTPQEVAVIDAVKAVGMFDKVDVPVAGFVLNMSQFICPDCGSSHEIFGELDIDGLEDRLGIPCLAQLPMDPALRMASDTGRPIAIDHPDHRITKRLSNMAEELIKP
jgi:ATP-binding protein involved in chromosome partitioning